MSKPTKKQLLSAYNTIAEEPLKTLKSVEDGVERCQNVINEYEASDIEGIPEETREVLEAAGVTFPKAKKGKKGKKGTGRKKGGWRSHCHERVYDAIVKNGNEPRTKAEIAELAITTESVVSNAFHDFRNGIHTPEGVGAVQVLKVRDEGAYKFCLDVDGKGKELAAAAAERAAAEKAEKEAAKAAEKKASKKAAPAKKKTSAKKKKTSRKKKGTDAADLMA